MTESVIFLDIDGVVAPIVDPFQYGEFSSECVEVLNQIVAQTQADVVISSSLRFGKSVAELQQLLDEQGFVGRVIDKTPTDLRGRTRGEEIAAWLSEHPVQCYIILDDHRDMGELITHLVYIEGAFGLRPKDVHRALAILTGTSPSGETSMLGFSGFIAE